MQANTAISRPRFDRLQQGLILAAVVLLFALVPLAGAILLQGGPGLQTDRQAPDFRLKDSDGRYRSLADYRGRHLYLMFGYIRCADICHTQVMRLAALADLLTAQDVEFLYLAMDSRHDDPEALRGYFDRRGDRFTSLHAESPREMQSLAAAFNAPYRVVGNPAAPAKRIEHPARIFLIDPDGRLRVVYNGIQLSAEEIAADFARFERAAYNS